MIYIQRYVIHLTCPLAADTVRTSGGCKCCYRHWLLRLKNKTTSLRLFSSRSSACIAALTPTRCTHKVSAASGHVRWTADLWTNTNHLEESKRNLINHKCQVFPKAYAKRYDCRNIQICPCSLQCNKSGKSTNNIFTDNAKLIEIWIELWKINKRHERHWGAAGT